MQALPACTGVVFVGLVYMSLAKKPSWKGAFSQVLLYPAYIPCGI
ncbi:hypothetical protein HMPREF3038_01657 [Akkermansia sp. KLE1797]|nr:hypothetical protein HMPREF3038_01657 [Akkermansia sp. KLE1797]KXU54148.1 hypothetical protein HMPREF3039_01814 [Akkermansia sp. KLE1798]